MLLEVTTLVKVNALQAVATDVGTMTHTPRTPSRKTVMARKQTLEVSEKKKKKMALTVCVTLSLAHCAGHIRWLGVQRSAILPRLVSNH